MVIEGFVFYFVKVSFIQFMYFFAVGFDVIDFAWFLVFDEADAGVGGFVEEQLFILEVNDPEMERVCLKVFS